MYALCNRWLFLDTSRLKFGFLFYISWEYIILSAIVEVDSAIFRLIPPSTNFYLASGLIIIGLALFHAIPVSH